MSPRPPEEFGEDAAFAGEEDLLGLRRAATVANVAFLGEIGKFLEMLHENRRVDLQLDIRAGDAVLVGAEGKIVPGGEILGMDPGQPGRGDTAGRRPAGLDLPGRLPDFRPGLRRIVDVEAGLLENVLVVIEDRRGRIVGEGQHRAVRLRIVGDDAGQILALVEGRAAHGQDFRDRLDRALRAHHRRPCQRRRPA